MPRRPQKRTNLTERAVKAAKAPANGRLELADGLVDRLVLRVTPKGVKTWSVLYQSPVTGKQERFTIGKHPGVSLQVARQAAKGVHAAVALGRCPQSEKRRSRPEDRPTTFAEVASEYLAQQKGRISSWPNIDAALRNHLLPAFGSRPLADLRRGDIHRLLDGLVNQGKRGAAREVKKHAHAILRWAHSRELVETNVAYNLHVPELRRSPGDEAGRALGDDELRALWICAEREGYPWSQIFHLLVLTGCRRMEVAGLRWSAVDLRGARFTIPRNKSGREHVVPLSAPALTELRSCPRIVGPPDAPVFTFRAGAAPVSPGSFTKVHARLHEAMETMLKREVPPFRPAHDFRVTAATRMSRLGVPREWVEAVQGRAAPALHAIYNKHDFEVETRKALDALAEHILSVVSEERDAAASE